MIQRLKIGDRIERDGVLWEVVHVVPEVSSTYDGNAVPKGKKVTGGHYGLKRVMPD